MVNIVANPVPLFVDTNGQALNNGTIYVGLANADPVKNPISVFQDAGMSVPLAQPLGVQAGMPSLNGTPIQVFTALSNFSLAVFNSAGNLVMSMPNVSSIAQLPPISGVIDKTYVSGTDFVPGTTTQLTLPTNPGAVSNLWIFFDGVYQADDQIQGVNGPILTFNSPIPVGVQEVNIKCGTTFTASTPSPGTVTDASVASNAAIKSSKLSFLQAGAGAIARTVQDKLQDTVSVFDFMTPAQIADARSNAATINATASFQAAVNALATSGGTISIPAGTFLLDTIVFPYDPATINLVGSGMSSTVLLMNNPSNPIIQMSRATANSRMTGSVISDFSIKANTSGSVSNPAHIAIDTVGFDGCKFARIRFLSNGASGSCYAMFRTAASPQLTYSQVFEQIQVAGQVGPGYVLSTQNNGLGVLYNTNIIAVRDCWFYNNTNMVAALDMSNCTGYSVSNCEFEQTGNYAVILGHGGTLTQNWFELQTTAPLQFQATASVPSAHNLIQGNYFSAFSGAFVIPTGCDDNVFISNPGGNWTISAANGEAKVVIGGMRSAFGTAPTLAQTLGAAGGTLTVQSAFLVGIADNTWKLIYSFTPPAAGTFGFTLTLPSGFSLARLTGGCAVGSSGVPLTSAVSDGGQFYITATGTAQTSITLYATLQ